MSNENENVVSSEPVASSEENSGAVVHQDSNAVVSGAVSGAVAVSKPKEVKPKGKPGRPRVANSGLSNAREWYDPKADRQTNVKKFMAGGISEPNANTYYHLVAKAYNKSNPK